MNKLLVLIVVFLGLSASGLAWEYQGDEPADIDIVHEEGERPELGGYIKKECVGKPKEDWKTFWFYPNETWVAGPLLHVQDLTLNDAGTYECLAINLRNGNRRTTWMQVDFPENWEYASIVRRDDEKFDYNGDIKRTCTTGVFGWQASWRLPDGTAVNSPDLTILNADRRHRGRYTCIASDPRSGKKATGWMHIRFLRRHKLRIEMSTLMENKKMVGGTLAMKCEVSDPDWIVHWIKADGIRVYQTELRVKNLRWFHRGPYWCIVTNRYTGYNVKLLYKLS